MLTDKDRSIITQTAFKEAGRNLENPLYQAGICGSPEDVASWHSWFSQELDFLTDEIFRKHTEIEHFTSTEQASGALQQAFPGAQPTTTSSTAYVQPQAPYQAPQQPQQYQPAPQQFQAPQQGYQAPPVQSQSMSDQDAWTDLMNNPNNWRDMRSQKRGPSSPDYVHAFIKKSNGKDLALWVNGQFNKPPQHILMALQQQGRA